MTRENERVVERVLELENAHRPEAAVDLLADDVTYVNPFIGPTDKKGWREFHAGVDEAFPDMKRSITRILSHGGTAVVEGVGKGTHRKELMGISRDEQAHRAAHRVRR